MVWKLKVRLFAVYIIIACVLPLAAKAQDDTGREANIYYFYINMCKKCKDADEKIDYYTSELRKKNPSHTIKFFSYNITEPENLELLKSFCMAFSLETNQYSVPAIFAGNKCFFGESGVEEAIEYISGRLAEGEAFGPVEAARAVDGAKGLIRDFFGIRFLNIFAAGLVNGLNPCSFSMLLFLISLLLARQDINIVYPGIAYAAGKFAAYIMLGSILYGVFSTIGINSYEITTKLMLGLFTAIMAALNIKDFFAAKKEKYGKITNQLPSFLRKMNHGIIEKVKQINGIFAVIVSSALLGAVISVGEFLCTGQVYLASIVYILQTESYLSPTAFLYLIFYSVAFITPTLVIVLIISKTRKIMLLSEFFRKRLALVKLLTAIIMIAMGAVVILLT